MGLKTTSKTGIWRSGQKSSPKNAALGMGGWTRTEFKNQASKQACL